MRSIVTAAVLFVAVPALAQDSSAQVRGIAEKYLKALTGEGDESGRELLLGGATMDAQLFQLENARIVEADPVKREKGDLASAVKLMNELDAAGRKALTKILEGTSGGAGEPDGLEMQEMSEADAAKLMAPTRDRAKKFLQAHPVLAYVARVGKEVYWHPKNPIRPVLQQSGTGGTYSLEFHKFTVESLEGPRKSPRRWPLRILRFKADGVDTGYKVLPASDWKVD